MGCRFSLSLICLLRVLCVGLCLRFRYTGLLFGSYYRVIVMFFFLFFVGRFMVFFAIPLFLLFSHEKFGIVCVFVVFFLFFEIEVFVLRFWFYWKKLLPGDYFVSLATHSFELFCVCFRVDSLERWLLPCFLSFRIFAKCLLLYLSQSIKKLLTSTYR